MILSKIFRPPFTGLAVILWLYFVICAVAFPGNTIRHGEFPDPDDYLYMTQTLDWLQGQGWHDNTQYRLDPPTGTPVHYFHLTETPLALLILPLRATGFDWISAATVAAAIWPLVLLAGLFGALRWAASGFMPRDWTRLTAAVLLFLPPLLYDFMPGHVDHHGLEVLLTVFGFGCIVRMMATPQNLRWGASAGFILALGQSIALEILPWLLLLSAWVVLWVMTKGRAAAKAGLAYGLTLFVVSGALLMLMLPPAAWFVSNMIAYSGVYVLLAGGVAIVCSGVALATQTRFVRLRYAAGIGLGLATAAGFFAAFPELLRGPYGAADKTIGNFILDNAHEAVPLIKVSGTKPVIATIMFMMPPLLALIAGVMFRIKSKGEVAWLWTLATLLLAAGILLSIFYQMRFIPYAEMFSVIPLAALAQRGLPWMARRWRGFRFMIIKTGLILLVIFNIAILPIPFFSSGGQLGEAHALAQILNDFTSYGRRPRVIINTIEDGSELLFRTHHSVLAAPYHVDVKGNRDALNFFLAASPDEAKKIARARHAELVTMNYRMFKPVDGTNHDRCKKPLATANFATQLACGQIPSWLKPVKHPLPTGYFVFEVKGD